VQAFSQPSSIDPPCRLAEHHHQQRQQQQHRQRLLYVSAHRWQPRVECASCLHLHQAELLPATVPALAHWRACAADCYLCCRFIANRFLRKRNLPQHQVEQHCEWCASSAAVTGPLGCIT
jgi:hypothetical protein